MLASPFSTFSLPKGRLAGSPLQFLEQSEGQRKWGGRFGWGNFRGLAGVFTVMLGFITGQISRRRHSYGTQACFFPVFLSFHGHPGDLQHGEGTGTAFSDPRSDGDDGGGGNGEAKFRAGIYAIICATHQFSAPPQASFSPGYKDATRIPKSIGFGEGVKSNQALAFRGDCLYTNRSKTIRG